MNKALNGAVLEEISSDDEGNRNPAGGPEIEAGERRDPNLMGGAGAVSSAGARPHRNHTSECPRRPHALENPDPIHELIAALREATLGPLHPGHHGLDPLPDNRPRVKIQPPVFKGISGERPDAHLLAAEDWMVAMRIRPGDFIENFRHTLQHLAREWYHSLDLH